MNKNNLKQHDLVKVIAVNEDNCVNCHACINACPVKYCNNAMNDFVSINTNLCIACGACLSACTHDARYFIDDFDYFLEDIKKGEKIIAVADSSTVANFPNKYKNLNGWLKSMGVSAVFDGSFGAELMVMSYVNHIMANEPKLVISQSCPAIVTYIELYKPELLEFLAPVESPILHTIKMVKEYYPKYKDYKVAVISPCAARKREMVERGLGDYNISFISINNYFQRNEVYITRFPEIDYDNEPTERAALISSPGGLLRTMERWMPDIRGNARVIEGPNKIYEYFDTLYEQVKNGRTPLLIDCLNCDFGCNQGPLTIAKNHPVDEIEHWIEKRTVELKEYHGAESGGGTDASRRNIEKILGSYWKDGLYNRNFVSLENNFSIEYPTIEVREKYYEEMLLDREEDIKNCMGCGYKSCEAMVVALNNNLNKIDNCTVYLHKKTAQSFEQLNITKKSLEKIIEDLPFGIILIGKDKKIIDLNPSALYDSGYETLDEIVGQKYSVLLGIGNQKEDDWFVQKQGVRQRIEIIKKNKDRVTILESMIPVNYRNEEMLLLGFIDITKIVEAEQKGKEQKKTLEKKITERTHELEKSLKELQTTQSNLKIAKENAEQANKLKSEFLANMSHEIRTPMNAILGFTKVLMDDETDIEKIDHLETISNAGENLLNLINEILDFSKIEADKLEIIEEPFSLKKLLLHFEKMLKVRANNKGIFFNVSVSDEIPDRLIGDRHRINQILINLTGNSIKFTENGGVIVNVLVDENNIIQVNVQDTGIGIPKDKQEAIFEPFQQADGTTTRKFGGTGLGLAISLKLIKMMGGEITLISEEGLGSKFSFTLPLKVAQDIEGNNIEEESSEEINEESVLEMKNNFSNLKDKIIGIIEDNEDDRKIFEKLLNGYGLNVVFLNNDKSIAKNVIKQNVDLIILDLVMDGLNGFEINKILKSNIKTARIPVIVSSVKDNNEAKDIMQYGIFDFLQKPINKDQLLKQIYLVLNNYVDIKNIIIIDDDENILRLYKNYLKNNHYLSFTFNNAIHALNELDTIALPDLIILDLKMPEMDGFEFLKILRTTYSKKELPVIIVTGKDLSLEEMKFLENETLGIYKKDIDTHKKFTVYLNRFFNRHSMEIDKYIEQWSASFDNIDDMKKYNNTILEMLKDIEENLLRNNIARINKDIEIILELSKNKNLNGFTNFIKMLETEKNSDKIDVDKIGKIYLNMRELLEDILKVFSKTGNLKLNFLSQKANNKIDINTEKPTDIPTDTILVVEDQRPNQKLIEVYFRQMKRNCDMAENGKIALEMMRKKKYKIVLLDMHMPVMNGMETIAEIRKDKNLKDAYVIALTADAMKGDAEKYVKAGCDAYLSKPLNKIALDKKLKLAESLK